MKKAILIPLGILCLFIITNPSVSAFKTYRGRESYQGLYRPVNLFVLSEYKDHGSAFIGVLGNFILVKQPVAVQNVQIDDRRIMGDSTTMVDTINKSPILPYKERVYAALKENISSFNTPKSIFLQKLKNKNYDLRVYFALKYNLNNFDKTPTEFIKLVNN